MNKKGIFLSVMVIVFVIAVSMAGTLAWFGASADAPENVFTAGTVEITAEETQIINSEKMDIVNPGDCFVKCFEIENTGSKAIQLRLVDFFGEWGFDYQYILDNWEEIVEDELGYTGDKPTGVDGTGPRWVDFFSFLLDNYDPIRLAPVKFEIDGDDVTMHENDWVMQLVEEDGKVYYEFYYKGDLDDGIESGGKVNLCVMVIFDGETMKNVYQGATFTLNGQFEAIQASNDAPETEWWDTLENPSWAEWIAMTNGEALEAGTSTEYAQYFYDTGLDNFLWEDCIRAGNGENDDDPDPKLTIKKILLDQNGNEVGSSAEEFTVTIAGGKFEGGQDFTFSVDEPKVLGPDDDLEFGEEYTVTEQEHVDYPFVDIAPTTITLTEEDNDITVTVVNEEEVTNGNGAGSAFAGSIAINSGAPHGSWFRIFDVEDGLKQEIYEGNDSANHVGEATITEPDDGKRTIEVDFKAGWGFDPDKDRKIKVEGSNEKPSERGSPGQYEFKGEVDSLTIEVDDYRYYLIHLEVKQQ